MLSRLVIIPLSVGCNKANQQKHIFTFWHYTADLWRPVPADILSSFSLFLPVLLLPPAVAPADSLPSCCLPQPPIKPLPSRARLGQRARPAAGGEVCLARLEDWHTHTQCGHTRMGPCACVCVIHSCTKVKANDTLSCATNQTQSNVHSCVFGITGTAGLCKMSKHIYDTCV